MLQLVAVSQWSLVLLWTCIALLYFVCGATLALQGGVYLFMDKHSFFLVANMELLNVGVHSDHFPFIGGVSLAMAALNAHGLASMVYLSLRSRSLRFASFISPFESSGRVSRTLTFVASTLEPILPLPASRVRRAGHLIRDTFVYVWQSFGVTSPNYGVVYILRELVQTGLQTYQAYRMSAHVARAWMNHSIVALLIINCWAMPMIQHVFYRNTSSTATVTTSRLLCLSINLALDFVSYFAFPLALFWPYARDYSVVQGNFERHFWYTDEWLMQWRNEWQLLFVTSVWDGVSKLLVAYSITRALRSIPRLVCCRASSTSSACTTVFVAGSTAIAPSSQTAIVPLHVSHASVVPISTGQSSKLSNKSTSGAPYLWRARIERWGHRVLGLWGLMILALHTQSSSTGINTQCLLQVRPWFTPRPVCALMEISCIDGRLTGNDSDFDATIDSIDSAWLAYLVIRHCPHVEITPRVRDLSYLMVIKIYNSTLVRWDASAALTQQHHPNMLLVYVVSSNMSTLPEGLYHHDFPEKLLDMEFSNVNLTALPDAIADVWPRGMFLVLEQLQLPDFPDVLTKFQPGFLLIANNNFTHIPISVWESPELRFLHLNGNPVRDLPKRSPKIKSLSSLYIAGTQVTQLPAWVDVSSNTGFKLRAGSTPLCEALHVGNATALGVESLEELAMWQRRVNCTPVEELRYLTHYPIVDEDVNNPTKVQV